MIHSMRIDIAISFILYVESVQKTSGFVIISSLKDGPARRPGFIQAQLDHGAPNITL